MDPFETLMKSMDSFLEKMNLNALNKTYIQMCFTNTSPSITTVGTRILVISWCGHKSSHHVTGQNFTTIFYHGHKMSHHNHKTNHIVVKRIQIEVFCYPKAANHDHMTPGCKCPNCDRITTEVCIGCKCKFRLLSTFSKAAIALNHY